jgi:hypothetical protein
MTYTVTQTLKLFVAGPPDVIPEDDPLAAFEGRKGADLWAVSASTGEKPSLKPIILNHLRFTMV